MVKQTQNKDGVLTLKQHPRPKNCVLMTDITRGDANKKAAEARKQAHKDRLMDAEKLGLQGPIEKVEV